MQSHHISHLFVQRWALPLTAALSLAEMNCWPDWQILHG